MQSIFYSSIALVFSHHNNKDAAEREKNNDNDNDEMYSMLLLYSPIDSDLIVACRTDDVHDVECCQ